MGRISIIGFGSILMASALWAQEPARHPITPEDIVKIARLSGLDLSPDGTRVLYGVSRLDDPASEKPVGHIWMAATAGGVPRQMTASEAGESSPAWAPDGKSFAFVSKRGGSAQVYVLPADGGEGIQVGKLKISPESGLKWSPDGKWVAFLAEPEQTEAEKAEDEKTGGVEILEAPHDLVQLFTLSIPEGKLTRITPGEYNVSEFAWAPDGHAFALVTARSRLLYDAMTASSVRLVGLDGKTLALLSRGEGPVQGAPEFSPDGTKVAWCFPTKGLSDMNGVAVATLDGKSFRNAADKLDYHFVQIAWMPGGSSMLALTLEGTRSRLRRLDPASGKADLLYAPAGVFMSFKLDRSGGRLAFALSTPESPANPWTIASDGTGALKLADLNPQAGEWLLPAPRKIAFESAPGVTVEALLDRTPLPPPAGPPPLMVMPHGGPDWVDQENFDTRVAYFAGQGYSVLRVNFRGSLGYGMAFYAANRGEEGFVDYEDVMKGVDLAVKMGEADPQRLVIGGWSYGGCLTEWAITRTDRFKAAVVGAGVSDYISNYAQSDVNHGLAGEWEFLGNPYDKPENYMKASAVFHIRSVQTPVLILHGMEDKRVPYAQGLELFRALKTTGKSVEMAAYPGEGHGFQKPKHRLDVLKRWSAFYDHALGIQRKTAEPPAEKE